MREAMASAELGDDVYGEDPTVNALEAKAAEMLGVEAALFVSSGTQSNLTALLTHCQRGDEYIAGQTAHTYQFEAGGAAVLGGIQPFPIPFEPDATLDLESVEAAVKPDNVHFAKTRLLCLENTQSGQPVAAGYFRDARALCDRHGLKLHLDGARLFNAAVALDIDPTDIAQHCDSISVCLSKGLGAPAGSVLCGPREFISNARRWRKMLGGGMRQAGVIASAGLYALENHVARLAEDHRRAATLAEFLRTLPRFSNGAAQHTNMVFVDLEAAELERIKAKLAAHDIVISGPRWVMHLDVSDGDLDHLMQTLAS